MSRAWCQKRTSIGKGVLGQRLKAERLRREWSLNEFADATGLDQSNLSSYENRGVLPKLPALIRIATVLDCSIDWLVGLED
jgi:XRE family transcriptional regulator, fatty acid utilization regulator